MNTESNSDNKELNIYVFQENEREKKFDDISVESGTYVEGNIEFSTGSFNLNQLPISFKEQFDSKLASRVTENALKIKAQKAREQEDFQEK